MRGLTNFMAQNFLAGSASNVGAWFLEKRCQDVYKAANSAIAQYPACNTEFQHLVAQVLECPNSFCAPLHTYYTHLHN